MKQILLFKILIFQMSCSQAQITSLDDFQWKNRLLMIYANDRKSSLLDDQLAKIHLNDEGYKDRDFKVIILKNQKVDIWNSNENHQLKFSEIIKKLNIDEDKPYQNLLIGKDGGVKLRSNSPIPNKKL